MKYIWCVLFFYGCSSSSFVEEKNESSSSDKDVFVTNEVISDAGSDDTSNLDSSRYNPCAVITEFYTLWPRLEVRFCKDSDGKIFFKDFYDLYYRFSCQWRIASDHEIRCLPGPIQSDSEYSDENCTQILLFGRMSEPFMGLINKNDNSITYYNKGTIYSGSVYYNLIVDGSKQCLETNIKLPNLQLYLLGKIELPSSFVLKSSF